ncbi:hypothetical protein FHS79_002718 [Polymorphobacter multimanifer]|uniref:DUF3667 domain-containing protein n=1 Tax=Polymorphobacter multimanifer TaxID=1070431 RepID=A0A841LHT4_9SPHN|nr:DUF3667 domain-containing protein [Polymorphobacter multimanifer]MBB6228528.1 hypothetical protein [Polymorphobacter multimanifer]
MAGEFEAAGDLVMAGASARALDTPSAGAAHAPSHGGAACANCGTTLTGEFCSHCGQRAHFHRTLHEVGHEILHGVTHFDGKTWTTLPMLLLSPGQLTREYIHGKRARYIAPVSLFLLVVFLMFFVFSFVKITDNTPYDAANAKANLAEIDRGLADLERQRTTAVAKGDREALTEIAAAITALKALRRPLATQIASPVDGVTSIPEIITQDIKRAAAEDNLKLNLGSSELNRKARAAFKNPELVLYKLQTKAYKLSFLLVPMSVPWLWLMFFWRRDIRLYDHAVFALYSISFMSLLFIIGSLALTFDFLHSGFWFALVFVVPGIHMFLQLKGAYQLSNTGALVRTFLLSWAAVITLSLYLMLLIILGVID